MKKEALNTLPRTLLSTSTSSFIKPQQCTLENYYFPKYFHLILVKPNTIQYIGA
uniref:Uncharacterized protein n=1 Tax=Rhizophora mucronata TaxID=61149 RepID=A0A2P2NTK0_RHIMU